MTDVIYLAPPCQEHERMWCEHDAPVDCECIDGPHPWIKYVAALRQPTKTDAPPEDGEKLLQDYDNARSTSYRLQGFHIGHGVGKVAAHRERLEQAAKVKEARNNLLAALRQPIRNDIKEADIDAMESILWVETIIDDQEAIAKVFARHRQYGYDQGYYDGQRDRQLTQDNALREALEAAPIISLWESKEDFRRRQDGWLKTKYRAALEQSK